MSYKFDGFFIQSENDDTISEIASSIKERWEYIVTKNISKPFKGLGVLMPDLIELLNIDFEDEDLWENTKSLMYNFESSIVEFSRLFPEERFVFINAECFGGTCIHRGYACINGQVILEEKDGSREAIVPLVKLLHVPISTDNIHFEPFERGFWGNTIS